MKTKYLFLLLLIAPLFSLGQVYTGTATSNAKGNIFQSVRVNNSAAITKTLTVGQCIGCDGSGNINGTGTIDYIPIFTNTNTIGNSLIYQSMGMFGTGVNFGTSYILTSGGIEAIYPEDNVLISKSLGSTSLVWDNGILQNVDGTTLDWFNKQLPVAWYSTSLTISNKLTYNNGSQGANKILNSDASGNATWVDPATTYSATFVRVGSAITNNYIQKGQTGNKITDGGWSIQGGSPPSNLIPDGEYDIGGAGTSIVGTIYNRNQTCYGTITTSVISTTNLTATNSVRLPASSITYTMLTANLTGSQTLTDAGTITWDHSLGSVASVTLTANRTLSITNPISGLTGTLLVKQDATGSRTLTLPSGSVVINGGAGAITLTTTANAIDIITFIYVGTVFYWTYGKNYN